MYLESFINFIFFLFPFKFYKSIRILYRSTVYYKYEFYIFTTRIFYSSYIQIISNWSKITCNNLIIRKFPKRGGSSIRTQNFSSIFFFLLVTTNYIFTNTRQICRRKSKNRWLRRPVSRSAPFYRLFSASKRFIEFRLGLIDSIKVQLCVATGPPWRYLAMVDPIADLRLTQMPREPREVVMSTYGKQLEWLWRILIEWSGTRETRMISEWFCRFLGGNKIFTFMILVFLLRVSMFIQYRLNILSIVFYLVLFIHILFIYFQSCRD